MNFRKISLVLGAAFAVALSSGCTSVTTTGGKQQAVVLGGLFEMREGAYEAQPAGTLPVNGDKPLPGAKLTGTKVSILWGLISYRDQ